MAGEIDKETTVDLLSDLMATNLLDTVSGITADTEEVEEIKEITDTLPDGLEVNNEETIKEETEDLSETKEEKVVPEEASKTKRIDRTEMIESNDFAAKDPDFYTRSMDLSDKDFDMDSDFDDKKLPIIVKLLIAILIIAILVVASYFIYQRL